MTTRKKITGPAKGELKVSNEIIEKIAITAVNEIEGVKQMIHKGSGFGQLLSLLSSDRGIRVEVGSREVAIDLDITVEYGNRIPSIVRSIRRNVTEKVSDMTGLEVVELNIRVNDIHFPEEERIALSADGEKLEASVPRVR